VLSKKLAACSRYFLASQLLGFLVHHFLVGSFSGESGPYYVEVFWFAVFVGFQILIHPQVLLDFLLHLFKFKN
jgi:hypothetical protein